jgi:hypothetical protein
MSALTDQLQQLKKQQAELEKRIQEEAENKKKLNNEASIERLEALVEPITKILDKMDLYGTNTRTRFENELKDYNSKIIQNHPTRKYIKPRKKPEIEKEEIYVTLIGILKKQDKKINTLESELNKLKKEFEICFASKYAMNGGTKVYYKAH